MTPSDSFDQIFQNKKKVMVVMAHPDDLEVFAGGTVARLITQGVEIISVKITRGDKGCKDKDISCEDLAKIREQEDRNSMKILGIKNENNVYLEFKDGEIDNSLEVIKAIVYQIRKYKPDLIITTNPEDIIVDFDKNTHWVNHRDHRNSAKSAIDAAYPYSRDKSFFPEQFKDEGITSHSVNEFLLADYYNHPNTVFIDVTDFVEKRIEAMKSHASQITEEGARESADFFTSHTSDKKYEKFRYVIAD